MRASEKRDDIGRAVGGIFGGSQRKVRQLVATRKEWALLAPYLDLSEADVRHQTVAETAAPICVLYPPAISDVVVDGFGGASRKQTSFAIDVGLL